MIRAICLAGVLCAAASGAVAQMARVIDMKGTWKMEQETILEGATPHNPATAESKPAGKYRLRTQTLIYRIDGQDGRRVWGTSTTAEHKAESRLIGSLSPDGKWVYFVGASTFMDGSVIDADNVELCVRQITQTTALVGCGVMKRQK